MNPETSHPREEEAIAYAFGLMDAAAREAFAQDLKADPALRALVDEYQGTAATMTYDVPQVAAPAELRNAVLGSVKTMAQEGVVKAPTISSQSKSNSDVWRWAAVAAAMVVAGVYIDKETKLRSVSYSLMQREKEISRYYDETQTLAESVAKLHSELESLRASVAQSTAANETLKQELAQRTKVAEELRTELAKATKANDSAQMQIAMLQSTVAEYKQGVAVVVWNSEKQEGILKLEKMPPVEAGKDYQLWVVDPSKKTPVNAGVVKVDEKGFAKVDFKPVVEIDKANNFAISVEQAGGVPENKGPIVLLSP